MNFLHRIRNPGRWLLLAMFLVTTAAYWPGLSGSWLFDDYPNIVDNEGVQPDSASVGDLVGAALSSPSSRFKRPLASLSFAANYLAGGLDPWGWKLVNLFIHLLNGLLVYFLAWGLLTSSPARGGGATGERARLTAALIAGAWMLLPVNLTGVLYVVQRMESLANLFVLLGLVGYVIGRQRMLRAHNGRSGLVVCVASLIVPTILGLTAKETAIMLPLYAFLIEWIAFGFQGNSGEPRLRSSAPVGVESTSEQYTRRPTDWRVVGVFVVILALPLIMGLMWIVPNVLNPGTWASRDFTLGTRLMSESRIVVAYVAWTLVPLPQWLSFYHDNFHISTGLLSPWTTLTSIVTLIGMVAAVFWFRQRQPLVSLGIALFLGCQLLTGTILPLELIYEHRNYFASFGLMLALIPLLAAPSSNAQSASDSLPFSLARGALLASLFLWWGALTLATAIAWGNPLHLAEELAARAPDSPRALYELGRTYIIYSHYDPDSPFTPKVYAPLEQAATLPDSSILPEQALIFFNARMHRPLKDAWWDNMTAKLKAHPPGVQDTSSLIALTKCARTGSCKLPPGRMLNAFLAALSHPHPKARLLASYGDYAWNVLNDHQLGLRASRDAVRAEPGEPAYHITLARMYLVLGQRENAQQQIDELKRLNYGGRLNGSIAKLQTALKQ
ncbi:MAG: hypothetical protein WCD66_05450 [Rhodanobacteraceae bacterium]